MEIRMYVKNPLMGSSPVWCLPAIHVPHEITHYSWPLTLRGSAEAQGPRPDQTTDW